MKLSTRNISIIASAFISAAGFLIGAGMIKGKLDERYKCVEEKEQLVKEKNDLYIRYFTVLADSSR